MPPRYKHKKILDEFWANEFIVGHLCGLCGNTGIIDTRGRAVSPAGEVTGGEFFCICPNGRCLKAHYNTPQKLHEIENGSMEIDCPKCKATISICCSDVALDMPGRKSLLSYICKACGKEIALDTNDIPGKWKRDLLRWRAGD